MKMGTAFPGAVCVLLLVIHSACALDPMTVDDTVLSADDLVEVDKELHDVVEWKLLGPMLGLRFTTLEAISDNNHRDLKSAKRDMILAWLLQKDCARQPSWRSLVSALLTDSIKRVDVAQKIAEHHKKGGKKTKLYPMPCDDRKALIDAVSSKEFTLDKAPISGLVEYVRHHGGYISYYNLGLALGMTASSLDVIGADNPQYDQRIIAMFDQWIRGGYRVNSEKGKPTSWKRLVEALLSPLVDERTLAEKIAVEHPKK